MDVIDIIQLFIPVVTFAMGYFLTSIGYKRDRNLSIIREKFEKLYHPFYMLMNELGTEREEGFEFSSENAEGVAAIKQLLDHLITNMYLASSDGQKIFWETRKLFISSMSEGNLVLDKEKEEQLDKLLGELFGYLLQEYVKTANALGYELGDAEARTESIEYTKVV